MHFTVNASEINAGMSLVTHALNPRPALQVAFYEGVLVETAAEGVILTCTDGEMTIRTRVNATVAEEGVALLPAKLLGELVRKLDGEIDIAIDARFRATIRSRGSNTSMVGMDAGEYPDLLEVKEDFAVEMPQGRLRDAVGRIMFAVSTDETRRIMTGCLIEVYPDETRLVGMDGFRLALQKLPGQNRVPEGVECLSAVVPGRIMGELCRMLGDVDDPVRVACSRTHMRMSFGDTQCFVTLLTGEYINYKQFLPTAWQSEVTLRLDDFSAAIDRASLIAREGKNNLLRLTLTRDMMTVTANAERGAAREELPVSYSEDAYMIAFNARYLSDVIKNVDAQEMCMRFNANVSPCIIAPTEGDQFTFLVLPVRVLEQA